MARRRGRDRGPAPGRSLGGRAASGKPSKGRGPREYEYVGGESDLRYAKQARARLRQQAVRRWVIRLAAVAVIGFAAWMWGPGLARRVRQQARQTAGEFQKAGKQMKEGTERRAGKGLDVDNP